MLHTMIYVKYILIKKKEGIGELIIGTEKMREQYKPSGT